MARQTLQTLIRLNRFEVDEKRRALAALLDQEAEMQGRIRRIDAELKAEQEAFASADIQQLGAAFGPYAAASKERKAAVLEELADLYPQIEQARADLADAFAELKKYEIAEANRAADEAAMEARAEGLELDEMGLAAYRRGEG